MQVQNLKGFYLANLKELIGVHNEVQNIDPELNVKKLIEMAEKNNQKNETNIQ